MGVSVMYKDFTEPTFPVDLPPTTLAAWALLRDNYGAKLEFGFYNVTIKLMDDNGKTVVVSASSPASWLSLSQMKATSPNDFKMKMARSRIESLIKDAVSAVNSKDFKKVPILTKADQAVTSAAKLTDFLTTSDLNAIGAVGETGAITQTGSTSIGGLLKQQMAKEPAKAVKIDLNKPVKLEKAVVIGQRVLGTSAGSVYRAVGISKDINLGVRLSGSVISVRAEGKFNKSIEAGLLKYGFNHNSSNKYWSVHIELDGVEPGVVVAGILSTVPVKWEQTMLANEEIKNAGF